MRSAFTFFTYCHLLCLGRTKVPKYLSRRLWKKGRKRTKKKIITTREKERDGPGVVESGHVTGRRGAKRRTRHRPPPGASPAAPCLSLPVSIFLLSVSVLLLLRVYPRFLWPLTPPPSTLANPSRRVGLSSRTIPLLFPLLSLTGGQY